MTDKYFAVTGPPSETHSPQGVGARTTSDCQPFEKPILLIPEILFRNK